MVKVTNRYPSPVDRVNYYPQTASITVAAGDWMTIASGYVLRATSTTANLLGVAREAVASTVTTHEYIPIQEDEFGLWECDSAVTLVQATHVGNAYDLTDHDTVNPSGTTYKVVTCLGITPEGRGLWRINMPFSAVGHI